MSLFLLLNPKLYLRQDGADGDGRKHRGGADKRKRKRLELKLRDQLTPKEKNTIEAAAIMGTLPTIIELEESNESEDIVVLWLFDL